MRRRGRRVRRDIAAANRHAARRRSLWAWIRCVWEERVL